ncbi:AAA family ATPase [Bdellovibrionota bacterium FG-2]
MINRFIAAEIKKTSKSVLLFGPRQVGKSTLIESLKPDLSINLSDELEFLTYSSQPGELAKRIELEAAQTVFIDEVQRLPRILNTVQALLDRNKKLKFYLTGSSARKLKRSEANLLPGRVLNFKMGPLVAGELNYQMDTKRALSLGTLPEAHLGEHPLAAQKLLKSYVASYLKEEIKAEALTRNLESFARFLTDISLANADFLDYTKLAQRTKISRHAVPRYFEILEDTLIGQRIFPFDPLMISEDLIRHPKFFFFDTGVLNSLLGNFIPSLDRIGKLAEQLVMNQILHSAWANDREATISSFRTRSGIEVDLIVALDSKIFAVEVKSGENVGTEDCEGLVHFAKSFPKHSGLFIFHMGHQERKMGPIWVLPWQKGLKALGL